jgi:hypothetical protein
MPPSRRDDGDRVSLFRMDPFLRPLHPLSAVVLPLTISWQRANEEEEEALWRWRGQRSEPIEKALHPSTIHAPFPTEVECKMPFS